MKNINPSNPQYFIHELLMLGYSLLTISKETKVSLVTLKRILKGHLNQHRPQTVANLFYFYCRALYSYG